MSVEGPPPQPPKAPEEPKKSEGATVSHSENQHPSVGTLESATTPEQVEVRRKRLEEVIARLEAHKAAHPEQAAEALKNLEKSAEAKESKEAKDKKEKDPHSKKQEGHGQGGSHGHEKPHKGHGHEGGHGGHHAPKLSGGEIGGLLASIGIVASAEPIIGTILLNNPVTGPLITGGLAQMGLAASGLAGFLGAVGGGLLLFNLIKTAWEKRKDIPGYNLVFGGGGGGGGGAAKKAPAKKAGGGGGGDHGHGGGH
jgi:hypothetical protein